MDTRLMRAGDVMTIERPTSRCSVWGASASIGAFAGTGVGACCGGGVALWAGACDSAGCRAEVDIAESARTVAATSIAPVAVRARVFRGLNESCGGWCANIRRPRCFLIDWE